MKSPAIMRRLVWEAENIVEALKGFPGGGSIRASLNKTAEGIIIRNMPVPLDCRTANILLVLPDYPAKPPVGVYMMNTDPASAAAIDALSEEFNAFYDGAHYDAPIIKGFTWFCLHYQNHQWRYNFEKPHTGDNCAKFLIDLYKKCKGFC